LNGRTLFRRSIPHLSRSVSTHSLAGKLHRGTTSSGQVLLNAQPAPLLPVYSRSGSRSACHLVLEKGTGAIAMCRTRDQCGDASERQQSGFSGESCTCPCCNNSRRAFACSQPCARIRRAPWHCCRRWLMKCITCAMCGLGDPPKQPSMQAGDQLRYLQSPAHASCRASWHCCRSSFPLRAWCAGRSCNGLTPSRADETRSRESIQSNTSTLTASVS
jgi:hypothetical protein